MNFEVDLFDYMSDLNGQFIYFTDNITSSGGTFINGRLIGIDENIHTGEALVNILINNVIYQKNMIFYMENGLLTHKIYNKQDIIQPTVPTPAPISASIPPPIQSTILTKLEFVNRFTDVEFKSIISLSKTNEDIEFWYLKFNLATYIDVIDPLTIFGVQNLELIGILNTGRANEILRIN